MATSGLYSNLSEISEKHPADVKTPVERAVPITGDGLIVLHGTRLDVDISVRISDLLNAHMALMDRVTLLEAMLGAGESAPIDSVPGSEIKLGYWRWSIDPGTGDLLFQGDLDKGMVTPAVRWFEKGRNSIDGDEVL